MCVCVYVCVCAPTCDAVWFCGLSAVARGLINNLVSHEGTGAYRQWKGVVGGGGGWCTTQISPCLQATPPLSSRARTCMNKRRVAHDERCVMSPHESLGRALMIAAGTSFMFGSKLLTDFDDAPRNNSGVCLRAVICGQMHSLVLITFNF